MRPSNETQNDNRILDNQDLGARFELLGKWHEVRVEEGLHRRAFVIEFAGMPKAGKSTTIGTIKHFLAYGHRLDGKMGRGYRVHTPAEGVSLRTPQVLKANLHRFNIWAGAYALQELFEAHHDEYHDLVILDRGPWDAGCWLKYWETVPSEDTEIEEHVEEVIKFLHLPVWLTMSDLHVVFVVDPEEAVRRENKRRLLEFGGSTHDSDLMGKMHKIYGRAFDGLLKEKMKQCDHVGEFGAVLVDTSELDVKERAKLVLKYMFEVIERKMNQPHYITVKEVAAVLDPILMDSNKNEDRDGRKKTNNTKDIIGEFVGKCRDFSRKGRGSTRKFLRELPRPVGRPGKGVGFRMKPVELREALDNIIAQVRNYEQTLV